MVDHASVHHALAAAQAEFPAVPKDRKAKVPTKAGGSYEYRYADFGSILAAVEPILRQHGIMQYQRMDVQDGKQLLCTELWHTSGTSISAAMLVPLDGRAPQEVGAAITYFRRYSMVALLGLVTEEDTDAQHTRQRTKPAAPAPPPVRQQRTPFGTAPYEDRPAVPSPPSDDDRGEPVFPFGREGHLRGPEWLTATSAHAKRLPPVELAVWWNSEQQKKTRASIYKARPDLKPMLEALKTEVLERVRSFQPGAVNGTGHVSPDDALRSG